MPTRPARIGNEQRHLEPDGPGDGVDADDLVLDLLRLVREQHLKAEIETFINDVSTTSTNIAIARRIASR
jgi:hypothetical protein